ncbi:scavenger receptor cysteine-rich domain-containing group B protein-like [Sorex araneus]|uniref:scavenger receptor cysteine-rich domain-containing group B protein-like n=1 Tax=Sorex araneus TaxID=42254 RepID=UPI0024337DDC|nr:scavenger receptor cysteine-rich domain-containing group B protein-like [Sorex araneus]
MPPEPTPSHGLGLRLVDGQSRCQGRVEVLHADTWGTVCDDHWSIEDAHVVCRQLGCGPAVSALLGASFSPGAGSIVLDDVNCTGSESALDQCPHGEWFAHNCGHQEDAGVICADLPEVRLADGGGRCEGRVEVRHDGTWGTVCDDLWDLPAAQVVCRQLGCGPALAAPHGSLFGDGVGPILLDNVQCSGREASLGQCHHLGLSVHNCGHHEDAGAVCSDLPTVRLADGQNRCQGRVEVYHNGTWGTVCDDLWGLPAAHVVCRQLGCGQGLGALGSGHFGEGAGTILLDDVQCRGHETSLGQCRHLGLSTHNCGHHEDAGVVCSASVTKMTPAAPTPTSVADVALTAGARVPPQPPGQAPGPQHRSSCGFSLQISLQPPPRQPRGQEGEEEEGEGGGGESPSAANNEEGKVPAGAGGKAESSPAPGGTSVAVTSPPVIISVGEEMNPSPNLPLRLVGGRSRCRGRVEVRHQGAWGTVCDDHWGIRNAAVVCRQLGCGRALGAPGHGRFGPGRGPILLDNVRCAGTEHALERCAHAGWTQHNCQHREDAGVVCAGTAPPGSPRIFVGWLGLWRRPGERRAQRAPGAGPEDASSRQPAFPYSGGKPGLKGAGTLRTPNRVPSIRDQA